MPRNAPALTGAATRTLASFQFIDRNGDRVSFSYEVDPAVTQAALEAAAAALSTASQALLFSVTKSTIWAGLPIASSAEAAGPRDSVQDQVNVLFKTAAGARQNAYIPAPWEGILFNNTDNVDVTDSRYTDFLTAIEAIMPNAFEPVTVRFVQKQETNKAIPAEAPAP